MSRRPPALAIAAAVAAAQVPGAQAAGPPELPRVTCAKRIADSAPDDAYVNPTGQAAANTGTFQTPGLDLEAVYLRATPGSIALFAKVKDIPAPAEMSPRDLAFRFAFTIKVGGKSFDLAHAQVNPKYASAVTGPRYPTTNPVVDGTTAGIDPATDFVHVVLDRANLEKVTGAPVPDGEKVEITTIKSEWIVQDNPNTRYKTDEIVPPAALKTWTVGDNYCFGPPPASLTEVVAPAVQYTDATTLRAKLLDESGTALVGRQVRFTVAGDGAPVTATTDADGVASASYVARVPAGTYPVKAEFPGTADAGAAMATVTLTVSVEPTKLAAPGVKKTSSTVRTVTTTLLDNDGKPVGAGQRIAWYVNGKVAKTLTTDAAGRSSYAAKPAQQVQARFAGVAGKLGTSSSATVRT